MNVRWSLFKDYSYLYYSPPSSWGLPFLYSLLEVIVALHLLII